MRQVLVIGLLGAVVAGSEVVCGADGDGGVAAGKPVLVLKDLQHGVTGAAFSPDGKEVAAVGGDGTARVWDAETGKLVKTLKGHTGAVMSCAWSPDGKQLATGSADKGINVWDAGTWEMVDHHEQQCPVAGIAFVMDEKHLVTLCGETVRWWAEGRAAEMFDKAQGEEMLDQVCVTRKGDRVVVSDMAGKVWVLDGATGAKVAEDQVAGTLPAGSKATDKSNWVMSLQTVGESEVLAGDKQSIWVWDWEKGTKEKLKSGGGYSEVLTPDRSLLVVALATSVEAVDVKNHAAVVREQEKDLWVTGMALSKSGERMALCSGGGFVNDAWTENGASVLEVYDVKAMEGLIGKGAVVAAPAKGKGGTRGRDGGLP